ncbi:DUF1573 domain-containing protein [Pedobacter sp.]|jgi:hypothetical protein|uniref:DUF1573 domain-containing protein n=1 Tax=Pedobacter sp. TaxID=1411316 RepID=UPI002CFED573|nr:DUF1573 domain-containing protein [Pedobacter sp.]HWW41931.1 DUF1573 domain-containing protein [Pedobacter sp.]
MKNAPILYLSLCLSILFFSCKPQKAEIDFNGTNTLSQILDKQKTSGKYLVLILTKGGCELCDIYKRELNQLNETGNLLLNSNLNINSIAVNGNGSVLNQLFRDYSFPLTLIFDKSGSIKGYFRGARPEILLQALPSVYSGKVFYNSKRPFLNNVDKITFSDDQKIGFINELFRYTTIIQHGKKLDQGQIDSLIKNTLKKPYFFNNYILAKAMQSAGDTIRAAKLADSVITVYQEELDVLLYQSLRNELRYVATGHHEAVSQPLITTPQTEINFGKEKVGAMKTILIPVKNVGKEQLVISNVKVSCDCLNVTWSHEPILSGKTGEIKVSYAIRNEGVFNQSLFVFSNSPTEPLQININGIAQII